MVAGFGLLVWVLAGHAAEPDPVQGIWHVRLRVSASGADWLGAVWTPGFLKEPTDRRGELEVELIRDDGTTAYVAATRDPRIQRWEYESAPGSGAMRILRGTEDEAECEVRLRDDPRGSHVAVFRRATGGEGRTLLAADDLRESLGRFELPLDRAGRGTAAAGAGPALAATKPPANLQSFVLLSNGPSARRLNIVFVSEGYRTNEVAAYTNLALSVLNHFLEREPFRAYRRHINARAVFVPSNESGSDHPSRGVVRDTFFQTSYDTSGIAYLLTIKGDGALQAHTAVRAVEPEHDIIVMLVNDPDYGGSGGGILVTSAHPDSPRIAIHELGHSFGLLADEYETPYPGYPILDEPNTTQETERNRIKWRSWIQAATPIPTPPLPEYGSVVGLFEGARYQSKGWYRPKLNCLMRSLGQPYCEVCREAMMLRFYQLVRPVDVVQPATNAVLHAAATGFTRLAVQALEPTEGTLNYEWRINDGPILPVTAAALDLSPDMLGTGTNLVSVRISDPTPWVRTDSKGLLAQTIQWRVASTASPVPPMPALQVLFERDGGVILSWPAASGDLALEMTASLAGTPWQEILGPSVIEGSLRVIRLPFPGDVAFFRLRRR